MKGKLKELQHSGYNVEELLKNPAQYMSVAQVGPKTAYETYKRLGKEVPLAQLKRIYNKIRHKRRIEAKNLPRMQAPLPSPVQKPALQGKVAYPLNILLHHKIGLQDILGSFKVILGTTGTGKSNTVAVLIEEYRRYGVPVHMVDVEGEHLSFVKELGFRLLNKNNVPMTVLVMKRILKPILQNRQSVIFDYSSWPTEEANEALAIYLKALWELEDAMKTPLALMIEEVHVLVPQGKVTPVKATLQDFAKRGRKRKIEVTFITQRSQEADKSVITQAEVGFLHAVQHPSNLEIYRVLIPDKDLYHEVSSMQRGEVIYINKGKAIKDSVRKRTTAHGAHTLSIKDLQIPRRAFK